VSTPARSPFAGRGPTRRSIAGAVQSIGKEVPNALVALGNYQAHHPRLTRPIWRAVHQRKAPQPAPQLHNQIILSYVDRYSAESPGRSTRLEHHAELEGINILELKPLAKLRRAFSFPNGSIRKLSAEET
jgi:hypothetical protein